MSFIIADWNINPNRKWYIKLADAGSDISVKLYPALADAAADTNLVAQGTVQFGTALEVVLTMEPAGSPAISLFNTALTYHLKVSGQAADPARTFEIAPFIDLPDISNNIYRSASLIHKKATSMINKHTHTAKIRSIGVADHNPNLSTDDVLSIQSDMRSLNVLTIVSELIITGTPDSLTDQVETIEYTDITHG